MSSIKERLKIVAKERQPLSLLFTREELAELREAGIVIPMRFDNETVLRLKPSQRRKILGLKAYEPIRSRRRKHEAP